jgi:hypothetical protein
MARETKAITPLLALPQWENGKGGVKPPQSKALRAGFFHSGFLPLLTLAGGAVSIQKPHHLGIKQIIQRILHIRA